MSESVPLYVDTTSPSGLSRARQKVEGHFCLFAWLAWGPPDISTSFVYNSNDAVTTPRGEPPMPSFPGMNPYLEAPDIWPDFHDRLASVMSEMLNAQLPEPYYSRLQMRSAMGVILEAGTPRYIIPDVVVARYPNRPSPPSPATGSGSVTLTEPRTEVTLGIDIRVRIDPIRHQFVEIRDAVRHHKLITLIEIASPSNKRPGADRRAYEAKQRDVLDSDVNLIELDLLRSGQRLLPYPDLAEAVHQLACDYLVLINRQRGRLDDGIDYTLYPIALRESLPCIPVPLAHDDPDIPLDLQMAVQEVDRRALYNRMVDYSRTPEPPLSSEDRAWVHEMLLGDG